MYNLNKKDMIKKVYLSQACLLATVMSEMKVCAIASSAIAMHQLSIFNKQHTMPKATTLHLNAFSM